MKRIKKLLEKVIDRNLEKGLISLIDYCNLQRIINKSYNAKNLKCLSSNLSIAIKGEGLTKEERELIVYFVSLQFMSGNQILRTENDFITINECIKQEDSVMKKLYQPESMTMLFTEPLIKIHYLGNYINLTCLQETFYNKKFNWISGNMGNPCLINLN